MGKGENAGFQHFLLFPQCFLKLSLFDLLPTDLISDYSQLKAIADYKFNPTPITEGYYGKSIKHCGKMRKCWFPTLSPFPWMFSKAFFLRVVKIWDYVVKSLFLRLIKKFFKIFTSDQNFQTLKLSQTSPCLYVSAVQVSRKHCRKRRNCS